MTFPDGFTDKRAVGPCRSGYARISTSEQDMALRLDALATAGCAQVFQDTASGAKADQPGLTAATSPLFMSSSAPKRPQLHRQNSLFSYRSREPDNSCTFVSPPPRKPAGARLLLAGVIPFQTREMGAGGRWGEPLAREDGKQMIFCVGHRSPI
jgi:Resolvase, N terminal domain